MQIIAILILCVLGLGVLALGFYIIKDSLKPITAWLGVICGICALCGLAVFLLSVLVLAISPSADRIGVMAATYAFWGSLASSLCLAGLGGFFFWLNSLDAISKPLNRPKKKG